ncbi:helix-turn-helix transcriptional regulator [Candidatus Bathyarchaeota archaeon]|nr:helix-turn-helix transcriptional regulator [Candidatus Bathyarchaeota archaeon]
MLRAGPLASGAVSPLQFLLLLQLNEGPKYGYEMLKFLRDEFEGVWEVRTGSLYPALRSLESRGFVETAMKDETEFYTLTPSGEDLLNSFSERIELRSKFTNRFFRAMFKLMPPNIRSGVLEIFRKLSEDDMDFYSAQMDLLNESMDKESMLECLDEVKSIMETRLEMIERVRQKIEEGS